MKIPFQEVSSPTPDLKRFSEEGPISDVKAGCYDCSAISSAQRCLRRYEIEYELGFEPVDLRIPLVFGCAIHAALAELHLNNWDVGKAIKVFDAEPEIERAIDKARSPGKGHAIIKAYAERYQEEQVETVLDAEGVPMIEYSFNIPIGDYTFSGRIDRVVRMNGGIYVMDHKTTSGMYWLTQTARPNLQFSGYSYAIRHLLGECLGVIVDALELPKTTGYDEHKHLQRFVTPRTDFELDAFAEDFQRWASIIEKCREEGHFPKSETDCFKYMRICEGFDVCTQDCWTQWKDKAER